MNYTKIYESLITKRKVTHPLNKFDQKCENHHIIPLSEGGTNKNDNMVLLTIKEHIFAHQLLARIYNDKVMWLAAHLMLCTKDNIHNKCIRLAEIARKNMSEMMRGVNNPHYGKGMFGTDNPFYGKHHSIETKLKLSQLAIGRPGWYKGKHLFEETKMKLSKSKMGKPNLARRGFHYSNDERYNMVEYQKSRKSVIQLDDDHNIIKQFRSIREAERETGINRRCIKWCLDGKWKHVGGFVWKEIDGVIK